MPPLGVPKKPWESVRKHRVKDIGSFWKSLKYPKVLFLLLFCFLGCPATPSQERSRRKTWSRRIRRNLEQAPFFLGVSGSWSEVSGNLYHSSFCRDHPEVPPHFVDQEWKRIVRVKIGSGLVFWSWIFSLPRPFLKQLDFEQFLANFGCSDYGLRSICHWDDLVASLFQSSEGEEILCHCWESSISLGFQTLAQSLPRWNAMQKSFPDDSTAGESSWGIWGWWDVSKCSFRWSWSGYIHWTISISDCDLDRPTGWNWGRFADDWTTTNDEWCFWHWRDWHDAACDADCWADLQWPFASMPTTPRWQSSLGSKRTFQKSWPSQATCSGLDYHNWLWPRHANNGSWIFPWYHQLFAMYTGKTS